MLYIGIDTGDHTGFAVWDSTARRFTEVSTLSIHRALERVLSLQAEQPVTVIFEDARQRKWIPHERNVSEYRGRLIGSGSIKRDAVIWEDFLKDYGIAYVAIAPKKGLTKWDADTFARVTGWKGRTSNHARDAAMIVFGR